jgi:peptide/nickel transport system ATP-binding protein
VGKSIIAGVRQNDGVEDPVLPPAVVASDLSIRYRQRGSVPAAHAVDGVSFRLEQGEIIAVLGDSGSGKSTLARVLAGDGDLDVQASPRIMGGRVSVLGQQLRGIGERKRHDLRERVGYLPQNAGTLLPPYLTAGESIAEPIFLRHRKFNQRRAAVIVATLVDAVRLPLGTMNKYPYELSAGQRQRIAIARALVLEPELLVADDPTSGVDVTARPAIIEILHELQNDLAFSAFIVTSNLWEVRSLSESVIIMYQGTIVGRGNLDEVLAAPQHPYVDVLSRANYTYREMESTDVNV